ncbi:MAG: LutB/LldF family L-lactate oxidation iron-sulfur protein [Pseudomonadota bacterium]
MSQSRDFSQRIDLALGNQQVRKNFRNAMTGLMDKRASQFADAEELSELRTQDGLIRSNSLANLPRLLEQLETKLIANGIQVHWAETAEQANQITLQILNSKNAKTVVKGKSMVSEEVEMNHYLEQHGIEITESDLGEFIIQLADEAPSHIVMPAVHKNRQQIAQLFHQKFPHIPYTEDVDELTLAARKIMRERFEKADAGITGVNFMVAETGTLCLVENEGNGRMCSTVPSLHIAITGIEKVVEKLSEVPPLLSILARSATGQLITTYFNMISSPRKSDEKDGPEEVHLILLDNGRSHIRMDEELLATLRCIRCGACINHCPVYVQLGGHAYGTVYPGPIGIVLEPQRLGIDKIGTLTTACTMCGACAEVCPVKIPLPKLINRLRAEAVEDKFSESAIAGQGSLRKNKESMLWSFWQWLYSSPLIYRSFLVLATRLRFLTPACLGGWTRYRSAPKPASKSLHELVAKEGYDYE